ncbi:hypothetical protein EVAR_97055_1 [Eumeta japonica]|uniref:Uncharacterized protein n=1 Tax=Eumeta variegata TaxID=151549 RepID=A0A4C1WNU5_EUMVA|nr:hypothetical protein EVAR_97055_1 [Eumeta japonica]
MTSVHAELCSAHTEHPRGAAPLGPAEPCKTNTICANHCQRRRPPNGLDNATICLLSNYGSSCTEACITMPLPDEIEGRGRPQELKEGERDKRKERERERGRKGKALKSRIGSSP